MWTGSFLVLTNLRPLANFRENRCRDDGESVWKKEHDLKHALMEQRYLRNYKLRSGCDINGHRVVKESRNRLPFGMPLSCFLVNEPELTNRCRFCAGYDAVMVGNCALTHVRSPANDSQARNQSITKSADMQQNKCFQFTGVQIKGV